VLAARETDAVLGISTSGTSTNVVRAMRTARELGCCTIAFAGRDGGPLADLCDHAFVVPSWSIHRIQEVHTVLLHLLWDHVHVALGEPDVL
jgi:D-sedoheptulose 7-phosphate isomerase